MYAIPGWYLLALTPAAYILIAFCIRPTTHPTPAVTPSHIYLHKFGLECSTTRMVEKGWPDATVRFQRFLPGSFFFVAPDRHFSGIFTKNLNVEISPHAPDCFSCSFRTVHTVPNVRRVELSLLAVVATPPVAKRWPTRRKIKNKRERKVFCSAIGKREEKKEDDRWSRVNVTLRVWVFCPHEVFLYIIILYTAFV